MSGKTHGVWPWSNHNSGACYKPPETLSWRPTCNFDNAGIDDKLLTLCMRDCDGLEATISDLLPTYWDQFLDFLTKVERDNDVTKISDGPITEMFLQKQKGDAFLCDVAIVIQRAGRKFDMDGSETWRQRAPPEGALQLVVPPWLRQAILYNAHMRIIHDQRDTQRLEEVMAPWADSITCCTVRQTSISLRNDASHVRRVNHASLSGN